MGPMRGAPTTLGEMVDCSMLVLYMSDDESEAKLQFLCLGWPPKTEIVDSSSCLARVKPCSSKRAEADAVKLYRQSQPGALPRWHLFRSF